MGKNEQGIAHIIEIIIVAVVIIGVGIFIWWRVWGSNNAALTPAQQALANTACKGITDQDYCKFLVSWKDTASFKVTSTQTTGGQTTSGTYETSNGGANYHMATTMNGVAYEAIGIGDTLYTKDNSDGSWWKQTIPASQESTIKGDYNYNFSDNTTSSSTNNSTPNFKKIGTEACGNLTCFKYQIIDPATPDQTQYIWFDNHDYQMRRMRIQMSNGDVSDQTFSYDNVNITAPSPTKDLSANQYVVPGQSQPMTIPDASQLQNMYQSMQ